ncbi:TrmH family RNA methyltransferase [Halomicronema hongdechloris]|uniref:TrmH family RNA methyltransferase n=1 Tax=Halomicronema hongdechloris TaxID=1209493 RepID=UPI001930FF81|nr:RNA methyltransferase [Halomicronema hongdechloris]
MIYSLILMEASDQTALLDYLEQFLTPARRAKIDAVLAQRTRHVAVVLEDINSPHNASAVLRTCDAMGVQDIHIIETHNRFKVNQGVTMGSNKWLTLHRYNRDAANNTQICFQHLRQQGYRIAATTPHHQAYVPEDIPLDQKLAVVLGSEVKGLSDDALTEADLTLQIPMVGFSESFNISVSAALCLYPITRRLRATSLAWQLTPAQQEAIRLEWYRASRRSIDELEKRFWQQRRQAAGPS